MNNFPKNLVCKQPKRKFISCAFFVYWQVNYGQEQNRDFEYTNALGKVVLKYNFS